MDKDNEAIAPSLLVATVTSNDLTRDDRINVGLLPSRLRREGSRGHLRFHRDQVHKWRVHERQRLGPERLPRRDRGPPLTRQVPVLPAGAFPQVGPFIVSSPPQSPISVSL